MIEEIGGYQLFDGTGFDFRDHLSLCKKNRFLFSLGRHSLVAHVLTLKPKAVYLPNYICFSVKHAVNELGVTVIYYSIDENFLPLDIDIVHGDLLVLVNYFGLIANNKRFHDFLNSIPPGNIVIDNTQYITTDFDFKIVPEFYSPRKFLPVTDGGVLYIPDHEKNEYIMSLDIPTDRSSSRTEWLFRALEDGCRRDSYREYVAFRKELQLLPLSYMSETTHMLLIILDIKKILLNRFNVYSSLQNIFGSNVLFPFDGFSVSESPIGFPLHVNDSKSVQRLLAEIGMYAARYWPELDDVDYLNEFEEYLLNKTLFLPLYRKFKSKTYEEVLLLPCHHSYFININCFMHSKNRKTYVHRS